jgi:hypothetical protein
MENWLHQLAVSSTDTYSVKQLILLLTSMLLQKSVGHLCKDKIYWGSQAVAIVITAYFGCDPV